MPLWLTERATLTAIAGFFVLLVFVLLCRARRVSSSVEQATLDALARVATVSAALRHGLTEQAAVEIVPHLRGLLPCVAVGISDLEGTNLAWDGEANYHLVELQKDIDKVLVKDRRISVHHDDGFDCDADQCPMKYAAIVPLRADGRIVGTISVLGGNRLTRLLKIAEKTADLISSQLDAAEAQESRTRLAKAEVRALRAQISPHFIYNALTTIAAQVRHDPEEARELLQDFAEFTRYSFRAAREFTTLADELRNIDRYLTLEQARYGDRLRVRLNISPEVLPVALPYLTVQPLVENAVRHGIAGQPDGGTITLLAFDNGSEAEISVEDDGKGMNPDDILTDPAEAHLTGAHVGLGNIDARLRAAFGDEYGLVVETNTDAGMKVTLRVPKFANGVFAPPPGKDVDFAKARAQQEDRERSSAAEERRIAPDDDPILDTAPALHQPQVIRLDDLVERR